MKDKEKQLVNEIKQDFKMHEEKHKQFEETIKEIAECNKESCKDCKIICTYFYAIKKFCEIFLHEDSVVLSREEYEKVDKEIINKSTYDTIWKAGYNAYEKTIGECVAEARKETTEKIFKMLISKLDSNQFLSGKRIIMEVDVENLAKQFDVEI